MLLSQLPRLYVCTRECLIWKTSGIPNWPFRRSLLLNFPSFLFHFLVLHCKKWITAIVIKAFWASFLDELEYSTTFFEHHVFHPSDQLNNCFVDSAGNYNSFIHTKTLKPINCEMWSSSTYHHFILHKCSLWTKLSF
jgi:hypothetical protein